ncbi:MAG: anthranilate synthase component I, partial [Candidatus Latescibacteria bacterium]|nr:anthranilate synthase component I [Candidatus Latescibacterota bacterium]
MHTKTTPDPALLRTPRRRRIPADLDTPVSAYLKLAPLGACFLLESVEKGIQLGRHSFVGVGPCTTITLRDGTATVARDGVARREPIDPGDIFAPVRRELAALELPPDLDLPAPFGGAVGAIAYDCVRHFEQVPLPAGGWLDAP